MKLIAKRHQMIVLRDANTKQEHASEASARRAIREWFLGYDFGEFEAPSKAAIRRAWSRVRGERDIESLASAMTSEIWSLLGKPADWCSYCAISVEAA